MSIQTRRLILRTQGDDGSRVRRHRVRRHVCTTQHGISYGSVALSKASCDSHRPLQPRIHPAEAVPPKTSQPADLATQIHQFLSAFLRLPCKARRVSPPPSISQSQPVSSTVVDTDNKCNLAHDEDERNSIAAQVAASLLCWERVKLVFEIPWQSEERSGNKLPDRRTVSAGTCLVRGPSSRIWTVKGVRREAAFRLHWWCDGVT